MNEFKNKINKKNYNLVKERILKGEIKSITLTDYNSTIVRDYYDLFKELQLQGANLIFQYAKSNLQKQENLDKYTFTLDEVLRDEEILQDIAKDINSKKFSPLEKTIALYDIVKRFNSYNIEDNDKMSYDTSRGVYSIFRREYIVCVGYSNLFKNLADRVGLSVTTIDAIVIKDDKDTGHTRNYINLIDDRYNINGYYSIDATFDNISTNKLAFGDFSEFLLTHQQKGNANIKITEEEPYDCFFYSDKKELKELLKNPDSLKTFKKLLYNLEPKMNCKSSLSNISRVIDYFNSKTENKIDDFVLANAVLNTYEEIYKNYGTAFFASNILYRVKDKSSKTALVRKALDGYSKKDMMKFSSDPLLFQYNMIIDNSIEKAEEIDFYLNSTEENELKLQCMLSFKRQMNFIKKIKDSKLLDHVVHVENYLNTSENFVFDCNFDDCKNAKEVLDRANKYSRAVKKSLSNKKFIFDSRGNEINNEKNIER